MDTLKQARFFLWRASLLGAVLVGALGVAYGALPATVAFLVGSLGQDSGHDSLVGAAVWVAGAGATFGALGALVGSVLGFLNGLILWAHSRLSREPAANPRGYRLLAGALCAAPSTTVLATDWALHGFDPNGFLLWRPFVPAEPGGALAFAFSAFTTLAIAAIMWWAGARVARSYLDGSPTGPGTGSLSQRAKWPAGGYCQVR
jgi:hypothetical protein